MNLEKLEELHKNIDDGSGDYPDVVYCHHAQLTADLAIKFSDWCFDYPRHLEGKSDEGLFDYFINNVYKPE